MKFHLGAVFNYVASSRDSLTGNGRRGLPGDMPIGVSDNGDDIDDKGPYGAGMHVIVIGPPPGYRSVIAELLHDSEPWAAIDTETGRPRLKLYGRLTGEPWSFDMEEALDALDEAQRRLGIIKEGD